MIIVIRAVKIRPPVRPGQIAKADQGPTRFAMATYILAQPGLKYTGSDLLFLQKKSQSTIKGGKIELSPARRAHQARPFWPGIFWAYNC